MKKLTKTLALLLAMVMCFSLLAACGGDESKPTPSANDPATTDTPPTDTPSNTDLKPGDGVLDVGCTTGLDTLTPIRGNIARDQSFFKLLFESLAVSNSNKELEPWVAKSWTTEDNGFTYDIEIWDIVYDAAGNHITASDIVWYIQTQADAAMKPAYAKIKSVTQTGDYTLQVELNSNVVGTFERILEDGYVVSQKAFEESPNEFGNHAVTTSAYEVKEFTASSIIAFERRDDYWQDIELLPECVRPLVEKVTYHCIPEASQLGVALETNVIDVAMQIPSSTGSQYIDDARFNVDLTDGPQGWQLFFSGAETSTVYSDLALRQAICYAIDTDGLIQGFSAGYANPMFDVCPSGMIGFNDKWKGEDYYGYDPAKATELLSQSNYNGEELILLATNTSQRMVEIIQNYLLAVGINLKLNVVDMALYTATRLDGTQYDMTINTIGGTYMADHWGTRYDPYAYAAGDATSRKDYVFGEILYSTWTLDGYTEENIDKVHYYLKDNAIAYGMFNPQNFTIWNLNLDMQNSVRAFSGMISPAACTYGNV